MHRARGNRSKFLHRKLCLDTRKQFFSVRNIKQWNRLTREVVESPWKYSRCGLAGTWKNQIQDPSFNRRLDQMNSWGPSQLRLLCDFMWLSKIYKKKAYNAFPCDNKFCLMFFIVIIRLKRPFWKYSIHWKNCQKYYLLQPHYNISLQQS